MWNNNSSTDNTHASYGQYATDSMDATDIETLCLMTEAYIADNKALRARQCLLKAIALQDIVIQRSKLEGGEKKTQKRRRQTKQAEKTYRFYAGACESDAEAGHWSVHSPRLITRKLFLLSTHPPTFPLTIPNENVLHFWL